MTGNLSTLSDRLALGQAGGGAFYAAILLVFVVGSASAALAIGAGRRRQMRGIYGCCVLTEAALLAALGGADRWLREDARVTAMVLGLAFLMGLQNAVSTRISRSKVRTTHISGMATDIGIELAAGIDVLRGRTDEDSATNLKSLRLHVSTLLSFLVGGVIGVAVYRAIGVDLLILSGVVLALVGGWTITRADAPAGAAPRSG